MSQESDTLTRLNSLAALLLKVLALLIGLAILAYIVIYTYSRFIWTQYVLDMVDRL